MKTIGIRFAQALSVIVLFIFSPEEAVAQNIYYLEPIQVVGQMNGYSTSSIYSTTHRRLSISSGTPLDGRSQWTGTFYAAPSGADFTTTNMTGGGGNGFLFISGPSSSPYQNKWVFNGTGVAALDTVNDITAYNFGNDMGLNMSDSGYYTFVFNDIGYTSTNARFYVGYTANIPVSLHSPSQYIQSDYKARLQITSSAAPSSGEHVYVRYSLSGSFADTLNSFIVEANAVSGDTLFEALLPAQNPGTEVTYYYFTSTLSLSALQNGDEMDRSLAALRYEDASGSNYSYTLRKKFTIGFSVDMQNSLCKGNLDSVLVSGNNAYLGNWTTGVKLNKQGSTQVYSGNIVLDSAIALEYKFQFHRGGQMVWEQNFSTGSGNREFTPHRDSTLATSCFGETGACVSFPTPSFVTFVTYLGYSNPDTAGNIYLVGDFTVPEWKGGAIKMSAYPGYPGYYYTFVPAMCPKTFHYKFVNGDTALNSSFESFPDPNNRGCTVSNGSGGFNRHFTRTGSGQLLLASIFDSCATPPAYSIGDSSICLGGSTTISATHAEIWQGNTSLGQGIIQVSPDTTTSYTVKDFAGNVLTQFQITVIDSLNVSVQRFPDELCGPNGTAIVEATSNNNWTYTWRKDGQSISNTSDSFQVNDEGWYHVRATDNKGCYSTDSAYLDRMTLSLPADTQINCGGNIQLFADVNSMNTVSYSWHPSNGLSSTSIANPVASPLQDQRYFISVSAGSCTLSDSILVQSISNFQLAFSANQTSDNTPPFDFLFDNQTPNRSNYQFTWIWGDGYSKNDNAAQVGKNYLFNGTYSVSLIAKDSNNCIDTLTKTNYLNTSGGIDKPDIYVFGNIPDSLCGDGVLSFGYEMIQNFPTGTWFTAYLSDNTGQFGANETRLDSFVLGNTGSISLNIPDQGESGDYKVQMRAGSSISNDLDVYLSTYIQMGSIQGTTSLNRLETASYYLNTPYSGNFIWEVDGGSIQSGQGSDSILVEWTTLGNGEVRVRVNDVCSDSASLTVAVLNVGINGFRSNDFTVYPNPTQGSFQLQLTSGQSNGRVSIYNTVGQIVFNDTINLQESNSIQIELTPGIYRVEFTNNSGTIYRTSIQFQ